MPIINVTGLIIPGLSELQRSIIIHHQSMKTDSNLIQISLINFLSLFGFVVDKYSFQWKVEGYLLTGINVPWRNRLHWQTILPIQIVWRGSDLLMSHGSFNSSVQICVCLYFSWYWSLYPAPDLLRSFIDVHKTAVFFAIVLVNVSYSIRLFSWQLPDDPVQKHK